MSPAPMTAGALHFPHGDMEDWLVLGGPVEGRVRVWMRMPGGGRVTARAYHGDTCIAETELTANPEHDDIAIADLALPSEVAGQVVRVEAGRFTRTLRTAPPEGSPANFSFWFGSCHQPFDAAGDGIVDSPRAAIYPAIARMVERNQTRFGLLLGDQVYADEVPGLNVRDWARELPNCTPEVLLDAYRGLYRGFFNHTGMRELMEHTPTFLVWDDHEIFNSWGSYLSTDERDEMLFAAASRAYREYQHGRNPGTTLDNAIPFHYSFWHGDAGFFVFDLRGERDYRENRVVGEGQWWAFDQFLRGAAERDVRTVFIVTSIPLVHFSPRVVRMLDRIPGRHGQNIRDRWDATDIVDERDRLESAIFEWQAARPGRQAVILSGDVHAGAAFTVSRTGGPGRFHQWTSSALTSPGGALHDAANGLGTRLVNYGENGRRAHRDGIVGKNNVGLVSVRALASGGHRLSLRLFVHNPERGTLRTAVRQTITPRY